MYTITLISTRHQSLGKCNSEELYQIIERINPEVLFEEIPPTYFDKYYVEKSHSNLETDTISRYIQHHEINHIPVDSDNIPEEEFFKDYEHMIQRIENLASVIGFDYRNLVDNNRSYIDRYGFEYLNSNHSININKQINNVIENGLQKLDNDKLFQTFKLWNEVNEMRENHMLQNIYTYRKKHKYERAIFMIGAAHRNAIIEKVANFDRIENIKLNWIF